MAPVRATLNLYLCASWTQSTHAKTTIINLYVHLSKSENACAQCKPVNDNKCDQLQIGTIVSLRI